MTFGSGAIRMLVLAECMHTNIVRALADLVVTKLSIILLSFLLHSTYFSPRWGLPTIFISWKMFPQPCKFNLRKSKCEASISYLSLAQSIYHHNFRVLFVPYKLSCSLSEVPQNFIIYSIHPCVLKVSQYISSY